MPEFVERHAPKQRKVFEHVPGERRIRVGPAANLEYGDEQPAPVHRHGDAADLKQPGGAGSLHARLHTTNVKSDLQAAHRF
jgi:hypothetical protein